MRNNPEEYASGHIPGAVYLAVSQTRMALKEPGLHRFRRTMRSRRRWGSSGLRRDHGGGCTTTWAD